jgi:hypothetical protein
MVENPRKTRKEKIIKYNSDTRENCISGERVG